VLGKRSGRRSRSLSVRVRDDGSGVLDPEIGALGCTQQLAYLRLSSGVGLRPILTAPVPRCDCDRERNRRFSVSVTTRTRGITPRGDQR
jgi:hypothetical protein